MLPRDLALRLPAHIGSNLDIHCPGAIPVCPPVSRYQRRYCPAHPTRKEYTCERRPMGPSPHFPALSPGNHTDWSSARRLHPTGWVWAGRYNSWASPIPESNVPDVSYPSHLGRMRLTSIQCLSEIGRRNIFGLFPSPAIILRSRSNHCFSSRSLRSFFQSWSRAPIVTN